MFLCASSVLHRAVGPWVTDADSPHQRTTGEEDRWRGTAAREGEVTERSGQDSDWCSCGGGLRAETGNVSTATELRLAPTESIYSQDSKVLKKHDSYFYFLQCINNLYLLAADTRL